MHIAVELGDETAHLAILFVDPERAGGAESGFFSDVVRFGVRVAGKVEGDGAASVEHLATRVRRALAMARIWLTLMD